VAVSLVGARKFSCRGSDRYQAGIQDTKVHSHRQMSQYARQEGYLRRAQVNCGSVATQMRWGIARAGCSEGGVAIGWCEQADSGGRLHVNRVGQQVDDGHRRGFR
jgi:hypothetical protein